MKPVTEAFPAHAKQAQMLIKCNKFICRFGEIFVGFHIVGMWENVIRRKCVKEKSLAESRFFLIFGRFPEFSHSDMVGKKNVSGLNQLIATIYIYVVTFTLSQS